MKLRPRSPIKLKLIIISTAILVWGGQTYVWNPFWLYYPAYPWYAMFWAFTLVGLVPKRGRIDIKCDSCGRVNLARILSFREGQQFGCKGCGKSLTFTMQTGLETPRLETLQEPEENAV